MTTRAELTLRDRVIHPLDVDHPLRALGTVRELGGHIGGFKVGYEYIYSVFAKITAKKFTREERLAVFDQNYELFDLLDGQEFIDVKLHDIKNTVERALIALAPLGARMVNGHAPQAMETLEAAVAAAHEAGSDFLGVTVLTNISNDECTSLFREDDNRETAVKRFGYRLARVGADGIICSALEAPMLREEGLLENMLSYCPGIRTPGDDPNDQFAVDTPFNAAKNGADIQIIGRSISNAPNPLDAVANILRMIDEGLKVA